MCEGSITWSIWAFLNIVNVAVMLFRHDDDDDDEALLTLCSN